MAALSIEIPMPINLYKFLYFIILLHITNVKYIDINKEKIYLYILLYKNTLFYENKFIRTLGFKIAEI